LSDDVLRYLRQGTPFVFPIICKMSSVRAKKHLGQHFLTDKNIALKIVGSLNPAGRFSQVLEVGPGMGILSDFLLQNSEYETYMIDLDGESVEFLHKKYPQLG